MNYCKDCGRFHAAGAHLPLWGCRVEDWRDDEMDDIRATDAEDAAERFLEYCWSNRYGWEWILARRSNEATHTIIVTGGDKRYRVTVDVELAPRYTARAEEWVFAPAKATEARRAETEGLGAQHESAAREAHSLDEIAETK